MNNRHHLVIIGGGFAGLYTAQALKKADIDITLIDRRNFHLFQPLLYQVATGGLSPGDIASPLRAVLKNQKNVRVLMGEVIDIDPQNKRVILRDEEIPYDSLIVATGATHSYFGNDHWEEYAPGLKTVEDATEMRRRILIAFEAAERETNPTLRRAWLNFVIVGGGPTGVELAGALGEMAHYVLKDDFRSIDPEDAKIMLIEGSDRILPSYSQDLSDHAQQRLEKLGVTVRTNSMVTEVQPEKVTVRSGGKIEEIQAKTVFWAAGVRASRLAKVLQKNAQAELDRNGRVMVQADLTLKHYPDIFVLGDLAHFEQDGKPLPGVAPVAMQQGKYAAKRLQDHLQGRSTPPFHYYDKGSMAVIGRSSAVADIQGWHFKGPLAWLMWLFVHIMYLVEFDNRVLVLFQWAWNYLTKNRGARLITGNDWMHLRESQNHPDMENQIQEKQPEKEEWVEAVK